ncbi:MAG: 1-acyl-sn-glycerol-3-phosphate acyltransferase [Akkermansiaceae bacterium]|nr:1-acyl-sn-glycerol-3-phosphate acyltransferase [Akkermansiaceae bacterium]
MRRLRNDLPYTFRPPAQRAWVRPFGLLINRWLLQRKYRIGSIVENGFAPVAGLCKAGHSVLLAPNHADHSDPHLMIEVASRHGLRPYFMGAREIFEVNALASWALQSMGVYSVDRDGPDLSAIKTSIGLIEKGRHPLVIYPEGEIYHHHERLDPLHEGVASILLKGAGRLPAGREAFLVPVGIRFRHDPSVEESFAPRLTRLEDRIGWTPRPSMAVGERIVRLGTGILALKETEFLGHAGTGSIQERLANLCGQLLADVESRLGSDAKSTTTPERVRALRYRVRRRLLDEAAPPTFLEKEALLDDLDRVFAALQAHSYIGEYLQADPTLDRRAETLMKLEEDLFGFPTYPALRTAYLTAGEPIPVSRMLAENQLPAKGGAGELTVLLESRLNRLLEAI